MSMKTIPPLTPLLYSKTGENKGIPFFLTFHSKQRLWVLVRSASAEAVLTCTHIQCFSDEIFNFYSFKASIKIYSFEHNDSLTS